MKSEGWAPARHRHLHRRSSDLARAQLQLVDARNAVATAKVALDNAMGLGEQAPEYRAEGHRSPAARSRARRDVLSTSAFAKRPDLKMLLGRGAGGGCGDQAVPQRLPADDRRDRRLQRARPERHAGNNFDVGLVVTWPIFNGFLTDHEVTEAKLRQDAVRHAIEDLRQRIVLQVQARLPRLAGVARAHPPGRRDARRLARRARPGGEALRDAGSAPSSS